MRLRLLFCSTHGYLDPSSGAALATRAILELLAARGADCRVLSTGVLDHERATSLDAVFTTLGLTPERFHFAPRSPSRRNRARFGRRDCRKPSSAIAI